MECFQKKAHILIRDKANSWGRAVVEEKSIVLAEEGLCGFQSQEPDTVNWVVGEPKEVRKMLKLPLSERSTLFEVESKGSRDSTNEETLCQEERSTEQSGIVPGDALQGQGMNKSVPTGICRMVCSANTRLQAIRGSSE